MRHNVSQLSRCFILVMRILDPDGHEMWMRGGPFEGLPFRLEKAIDYRRGQLHIKDRQSLEQAVCECYAVLQADFEDARSANPPPYASHELTFSV